MDLAGRALDAVRDQETEAASVRHAQAVQTANMRHEAFRAAVAGHRSEGRGGAPSGTGTAAESSDSALGAEPFFAPTLQATAEPAGEAASSSRGMARVMVVPDSEVMRVLNSPGENISMNLLEAYGQSLSSVIPRDAQYSTKL